MHYIGQRMYHSCIVVHLRANLAFKGAAENNDDCIQYAAESPKLSFDE